MLQSMTGFAAKEGELIIKKKIIHTTFMLKSLNGRYFEAHCKLPPAISALETEIIKKLKKELKRGTVYLSVYTSTGASLQADIRPSLNIIGQYLDAIKKAQEAFPIQGEVTVTELVRLPNIFETFEPLITDDVKQQIFSALDDLIKELNKGRIKEGEAIKADLSNRISEMTNFLADLEPRALAVMEKKKKDILALIAEAQKDDSGAEINAAATFYPALDKIDIHEEITRFKNMLTQLKDILANKEIEKGKKIDFTLQELFREINTITAKCSDSIISKQAINIKVELEKSRELAQNIL